MELGQIPKAYNFKYQVIIKIVKKLFLTKKSKKRALPR